ncbi:MAG: glutaredoxin 3 [Alphaproteobacteria bacterium]|tara:strand:+ start:2126 stop:2422 length:297 start_codon:yes stop_codon:yes gene_type:complete
MYNHNMLPLIEMYTSKNCFFCSSAKQLLDKKKLQFSEIDITTNNDEKNTMIKRSRGMHTVPQIFINNIHIGGCEHLYALEELGRLDKIILGIFDHAKK